MRGRGVMVAAAWALRLVGVSVPAPAAAAAAWARARLPRMDPACCARPGSSVFGLPWSLFLCCCVLVPARPGAVRTRNMGCGEPLSGSLRYWRAVLRPAPRDRRRAHRRSYIFRPSYIATLATFFPGRTHATPLDTDWLTYSPYAIFCRYHVCGRIAEIYRPSAELQILRE